MNGTRHDVAAAMNAAVTGPRNCPTANACRARLWFDDGTANSGFAAGIEDVEDGKILDYFLLNNFLLGPDAGAGPKNTSDAGAGKRCSAFKPLGTWKIAID